MYGVYRFLDFGRFWGVNGLGLELISLGLGWSLHLVGLEV